MAATSPSIDHGPAAEADAVQRGRALTRDEFRAALRVGIMGAVLTAVVLLAFTVRAGQYGQIDGDPYVVDFPTTGALNVMLAQGDGQAFAALATDPALDRPEQFAGQTADTAVGVEAAYRAQRPLLGYLAWATSLGQADLVNPALLAWGVVGGGLAAGGLAALLLVRGSSKPELALLALILPGALLATSWLGPECLGLGLAALGLVLFERNPRGSAQAIVLFTLAALCRESMLLIPAGLGLWLVLRQRDLRRALPLAVPAVVYAGWVLVVHARFDAWPTEASAGRTGAPFAGLVDAFPQMSTVDIGFVVVNLLLIAVVVAFRRDPLAWIIGLSVLFAITAGWDVWLNRGSINRVMLPAQVLAGVLLLTRPKAAAADDALGADGAETAAEIAPARS